jgi:hypothetical protein
MVIIEPRFSLDQPRQINHVAPDGILAKAARRWHMEAKRAERRSDEAPTALDGRKSLELRTVAGPAP